jgi:TRAP-type mannitol/chloroaromatic compound transport system substrate-binding protein
MKVARKTTIIFILSVTVVALSALAICTASAKELPKIHWRIQVAFPAGDHEADIAVPERIKYIEERTKGRFTLTRFYAGEIMPPEEMITGIGAGLAEMGEGAATYWSGLEKALDLSFGLPGTNRKPLGDAWALQNGSKWSHMVSEIFAEHGCHYIGWHDYGPYPIFCSNKPIRKIEDWKGVKVRISGYSAKLLEAMGASTTYIPGAEIAQALTTGAIDVGTWTAEAIKDMGFGSVMDYLILPPFMDHGGGVLFANKKAWDALPEEYKTIVKESEIIAHLNAYKFWQKYMSDNINLAKGVGKGPYGYEVIRLPEKDVAEMNKLAEKVVWAEWAKNSPRCARAVEILKEWYSGYRE